MKTVKEKLGVKEGKEVLVIHAPKGYREIQGNSSVEKADIIQLFITFKKELQDFVDQNLASLKPTIALWITYPKASPQLGINRDILVELLSPYGLEGVAICAIDEKWSALRFKKQKS